MNNIKAIGLTQDGALQRIAVTYDVVDETTGKVTKPNVKVNRIVTDDSVLSAISEVSNYAKTIIEES